MDSLRLVVEGVIPLPSTFAPRLGAALDSVVMTALARNPNARFRSAAELADALEATARRRDLIASPAQVGSFVRHGVRAQAFFASSVIRASQKQRSAFTAHQMRSMNGPSA
jgi:hypothetical protein